MPKTITLRLFDEDCKLFRNYPEADNHPLANLIETAAKRHLKECAMVSKGEMAEIRKNPLLVSWLKAGSKAARKKRGRFVD